MEVIWVGRESQACKMAACGYELDVRIRSVALKQNSERLSEGGFVRDERSIDHWLVDKDTGCLDAFQTPHVFTYVQIFSKSIDPITSGVRQAGRQSLGVQCSFHQHHDSLRSIACFLHAVRLKKDKVKRVHHLDQKATKNRYTQTDDLHKNSTSVSSWT